ncbi:MAG: hypothetical protein JSU66_15520 [Deltaproteobacteria bacterium]|nr:MAG: hypothetical protein JSU66_15520 [Deltaproteobacteria bacterium]
MTDACDEADAITLDERFRRHDGARCDRLEIDCEGSEYEIPHAASDETRARIDRIHAEYHNASPDDLRTRIGNFGTCLQEKRYATEVEPHRCKPNHGMIFASRLETGVGA